MKYKYGRIRINVTKYDVTLATKRRVLPLPLDPRVAIQQLQLFFYFYRALHLFWLQTLLFSLMGSKSIFSRVPGYPNYADGIHVFFL